MKVNVNLELCCGNGLCAANCPQVFELVDGKAIVKVDEVPLDLQEALRNGSVQLPNECHIHKGLDSCARMYIQPPATK